MVTVRSPRVQELKQLRGVHAPTSSAEFRVITLKDPVFDPEWMFHHPRFQRETKKSEKLPQIEPGLLKYTKKIFSRVPSSRGYSRNRIQCERREHDRRPNSTCRHFCELLGPNLCKDCWKLCQRSEAVREHRDIQMSYLERDKDSFSQIIASRLRKAEYSDSEDEVFHESEDEEFIFKKPASYSRKQSLISSPPHDSGYSSRMSYIRSLSRTPSSDFCPRVRSSKPSTRESGVVSDEHTKDISITNSKLPTDEASTPIWKNAYLARLRERKPYKDVWESLYYPRKLRHAWRKLPVEPVVMDLKLINFTIYDSSPLNERVVTNTA